MDKAAKEAPSPKKAREESRSATEQVIDVLKESRSALADAAKQHAPKRTRARAVASEVMMLKCAYDFSRMDEPTAEEIDAAGSGVDAAIAKSLSFVRRALNKLDEGVRYSAVELCLKRVQDNLDKGTLDPAEYEPLLEVLTLQLFDMEKPTKKRGGGKRLAGNEATIRRQHQKAPGVALLIRIPPEHALYEQVQLQQVFEWSFDVNSDGGVTIVAKSKK
jgi:hypothetical protein